MKSLLIEEIFIWFDFLKGNKRIWETWFKGRLSKNCAEIATKYNRVPKSGDAIDVFAALLIESADFIHCQQIINKYYVRILIYEASDK